MKNKIIFSSAFIILTILFIGALPTLVVDQTTTAKGAKQTIASIDVTGKNDEEITLLIEEAIAHWLAAPPRIIGSGTALTLTAEDVTFDITSTLAAYKAMTKKSFWQKTKPVQLPLEVSATEALQQKIAPQPWEQEETLQAALAQASMLADTEIIAIAKDNPSAHTLATATLTAPAAVEKLQEVVANLDGQVIAPGEIQSTVSLVSDLAVNQETLDFVATAIYYTVLQTTYDIIERSPQLTPPSYIEQGYEASIDKAGLKDMLYINEEAVAGVWQASLKDNRLTVAITAAEPTAKVNVTLRKNGAIQPKTIYRYSRSMAPGTEKVLEPGANGAQIEVVRTVVDEGKTKEEVITKDYYPPANRIVMTATKPKETPKETPPPAQTKPQTTTEQPTKDNPPLKSDGTPDASQDDGSGDKQVTKDGYYDKAGNFHSTK